MDGEHGLFSENEEWKDVSPIPQNDGPEPVVPIAYTSEFTDAMDYFRAVLASGETSDRVLRLTTRVIQLNAANYTVWHFRRVVLQALSADLSAELEYLDDLAEENPKNYQVWYHRMWAAGKIGASAALREKRFTARILEEDPKNYHAWSHRQWVLRNLGGWEGELEFTADCLEEDVRNNSAWNQRYFVVKESPHLGGLPAMRSSELDFCRSAVEKAPLNESVWRYLRGLYDDQWEALLSDGAAMKICRGALTAQPKCVPALSLLLDMLSRGARLVEADKALLGLADDESSFGAAVSICSLLESDLDPIRSGYWKFRKGLILQSQVAT